MTARTYTATVVGGGAGGTLSLAALSMSHRYRLVGACDLREDVCAKLRAQFPGLRTFTDYQDMFRECPSEVVCVSTYPPTHEPVTIAALETSLMGILVEKPLGDTAAAGRRILAAVAKKGIPMAVPHGLLVRRHATEIIQRVQQGEIGELRLVEIQCRGWDIMNAGIHWLNFFVALTPGDPPAEVMALADKSSRTWRDGMQVETVAVTSAQTKTGVRVVMHTGDTIKVNSPNRETVIRLLGSEGQIEFYGWDKTYRIFNPANPRGTVVEPSERETSAHQRHLDALADMMDTGTPDYSVPQSSLAALELCEGAYQSSREGRAIALPLSSNLPMMPNDWDPGRPYAGVGGGRDGRKL